MKQNMIRRMLKRSGSALMVIAMLAFTIGGAAAQVQAFSVFGFSIGEDKTERETPVTSDSDALDKAREKKAEADPEYKQRISGEGTETAQQAIQEHMPEETQEHVRERVNAREAVRNLNQRKGMQAELKGFEKDVFCIKTEERTVNMAVSQKGALDIVNGTPEDCYEIETKEAFLSRAYHQIERNQYVSKDELKENMDMPWGLRMKISYNLMKRSIFS